MGCMESAFPESLYGVDWLDPVAWFGQPLALHLWLEENDLGAASRYGSPIDTAIRGPLRPSPLLTPLFDAAAAPAPGDAEVTARQWAPLCPAMADFYARLRDLATEADAATAAAIGAEIDAFRAMQRERMSEEIEAQSSPGHARAGELLAVAIGRLRASGADPAALAEAVSLASRAR